MIEQDHEYQNVVLTVTESPKTEYVVALEDSDGEFLTSDPVHRDPRVHSEGVWNDAEISTTHKQLEET